MAPNGEGDSNAGDQSNAEPEVEQTGTETQQETLETETTEAEVVDEADVVEDSNPQLTPEVEALATFSEQEGPLSFRIIPVIQGSQTDWRILVYMRGAQGPVYQSREELTDEAAMQFGISNRLQDRINSALSYAKEELEVPEELGDQKRTKRSLHELEVMMGE